MAHGIFFPKSWIKSNNAEVDGLIMCPILPRPCKDRSFMALGFPFNTEINST